MPDSSFPRDNPAPALDLVSLVHSIDERLDRQAPFAAPPLEPAAAQKPERWIQFALGAQVFALPISTVLETANLPPITPLPGIPAAIRGVLNFRGDIIPAVDLRPLLVPQQAGAIGERILVVKTAESGGPCALLTDRVLGLLQVSPSAIRPASGEFLRGQVPRSAGLVSLVDLDSLFRSLSATLPGTHTLPQPTSSEESRCSKS